MKKYIYIVLIFFIFFCKNSLAVSIPLNSTCINIGNGYYSSDSSKFAMSGKDVFVTCERDFDSGIEKITLFEPFGLSGGTSSANAVLYNGTYGIFRDAIIGNDGFLYASTMSGIFRKSQRGIDGADNLCTISDVLGNTCTSKVTSDVALKFYKKDSYIYYMTSTHIKRFSTDDLTPSTVLAMTLTNASMGAINTAYPLGFGIDSSGIIWYAWAGITGGGDRISIVSANGNYKWGYDGLNLGTSQIYYNGDFLLLPTGEFYIFSVTGTIGNEEGYIHNSSISSYYQFTGGSDLYPLCTSPNHQNNQRSFLVNGENQAIGMMLCGTKSYSYWNSGAYLETFGTNATSQYGSMYELSYKNKDVESLYDIYYQNSDFEILTYIRRQDTAFSTTNSQYIYSVRLLDTNNAKVNEFFFNTVYNFDTGITCMITLNCDSGYQSVIKFSPITNWTNGSYSVQLIEKNISNGNIGVLDTDTFQVYLGNVTGSKTPGDDVASLPMMNTLNTWVGLLGLGVNSVSKFLFAIIFIIGFMVAGFRLGKEKGAMLMGFIPFGFFTYVSFIPYWFIVILILLIAMNLNIFR